MRTEMVIRMQGGSEKGHAAMKVAAASDGVESVTLSGKDKSLLRVVGDGVDSNRLTTRLRRKVGRADLVELRTLHAGGGGYYGSSSRAAGSSLSRVDSGYGGGSYGSSSYYPTTTSSSYAPEYYQPSSASYGHYPAPAYAAAPTVVHHEYYPPSTDPNGCSIM